MIQPIAVFYYEDNWKEPTDTEVHEFDIENGVIVPSELSRWRAVQDEGMKRGHKFVGWVKRNDHEIADAAVAYWEECWARP